MNAVVFPGQGAQYRGMGKNLYDHFPQAQKMFSCVEDLFGKKITDICFQGHGLDDIYNQQLAIVATSLAIYVVFREKGVKIDFFSGLSLGEYTCLYPSGVLSLEDLVSLVKKRAEVTREAAAAQPAAMLAIIGIAQKDVEALSKKEGFYVANINSERQIVVTVAQHDKARIKALLDTKAKKVVEVNTGGGFHSPYMLSARHPLKEFAQHLRFRQPIVPIVGNLTGTATQDPAEIRANVVEQLVGIVRWKECVEFMERSGVDTFIEIGPSKVLKGLITDVAPRANIISLEKKRDFDTLDKFLML